MFQRKFIRNRLKKTQILMIKPVYLGLSMLDLSKTVMYEFWYDYLKPRQLYFSCENRWYLQRHCKRCWKKKLTLQAMK